MIWSPLRHIHSLYFWCAVLIFFHNANLSAQTFHDFLGRVEASPPVFRQVLADSFMSKLSSVPFIECDTICTFLWQGVAVTVAVAGDHNDWTPARGPMTRISETNLWYRTEVFPADTRLDYKFVRDSTSWVQDPLNHFTVVGGFGPNSELRMPAWRFPREVEIDPAVPHGRLIDTMFSSEVLGDRRKIRVYLPHDVQNPTDSLALIIVHDGRDYAELAKMPNVLDNLIAGRAIKSTIAVFIPPVDRNAEYAGRKIDRFTSFVVSEVVAFARRGYRISSKASDCATLGASNGGNIALWLGMTHPEIFGGVAAQSSNVTDTVAHGFRVGSKRDLRIYLDIGTFDVPTLIPRVKALGSVLENRGYDYLLREVHEGHSWGSWRSRLSEILRFLFPAASGGTREYSFPSKRTP